MGGDVGNVVDPSDEAAGVDEEADTPGEGSEPVVGRSGHAEGRPDDAVGIAEEGEGEFLVGGERGVLLDGVERCADDDGPQRLEPVDPVTQGLSFDRSTGGGRLRVPPEQHPAAGQVGETNRRAPLVGQLERRCGIADVDHAGHARRGLGGPGRRGTVATSLREGRPTRGRLDRCGPS